MTGFTKAPSFSRRTGLAVAGAAVATGLSLPVFHGAAQDTQATPAAAPPGVPGVDPQIQEVLDAIASFNAPPLETVTPFVGRNLPSFANGLQVVLANQEKPGLAPVGRIDHILIPAQNGESILARLYYPAEMSGDPLPVLVYFHGGGFVIADLDTYDSSCRALATATGAIVASVAYRLAPEYPFPTAVDDAFAATQYFLASAATVGGDPERVVVIGESAGGNLATVSCLRARDEGALLPVYQVLVYPVTTFAPEGEAAESVELYANAKPLNSAQLEWFASYYLADPADAANPLVSPLTATDLSGLPPVTIVQAEIDPLQSQGTVYADALEAAGVQVLRHFYAGATHEFFGMGAVVDIAQEAVAQVAADLQQVF